MGPQPERWLEILCSSLSRTRMAWAREELPVPELLHRQDIGQVVGRAIVIEPVGERNALVIGLVLGQLLQTRWRTRCPGWP
jgi:hypothetical protein